MTATQNQDMQSHPPKRATMSFTMGALALALGTALLSYKAETFMQESYERSLWELEKERLHASHLEKRTAWEEERHRLLESKMDALDLERDRLHRAQALQERLWTMSFDELERKLEENRAERRAVEFARREGTSDGYHVGPMDHRSVLSFIMKRTRSDEYHVNHFEHFYGRVLPLYRDIPMVHVAHTGREIAEGRAVSNWAEYFDNPTRIMSVPDNFHSGKKKMYSIRNRDAILVRVDVEWKKEESYFDAVCPPPGQTDWPPHIGPYHFMVDEMSRQPHTTVSTFAGLFDRCVAPGGMYVMQGVEDSYWHSSSARYPFPAAGIGSSPQYSAVEKMKQVVDVINGGAFCMPEEDVTVLKGDDEACSISFSSNIVMLHKCTEEEKKWSKMAASRACRLPETKVDKRKVEGWLEMARKTNANFNGPAFIPELEGKEIQVEGQGEK